MQLISECLIFRIVDRMDFGRVRKTFVCQDREKGERQARREIAAILETLTNDEREETDLTTEVTYADFIL